MKRFDPVVWLGVGVVFLLHVPEAVKLPFLDQANFELMGREMVGGQRLYADLFDVKPPLIYLVYAGIHWIIGGGHVAVVVLDALLAVLTILLLAHYLEEAGPVRRRVGVGIWVSYLGMPAFGGELGILQPETLVTLFMALTLVGAHRPFLVGILAGLGFLAKFTPALPILVIGWMNRDRRSPTPCSDPCSDRIWPGRAWLGWALLGTAIPILGWGIQVALSGIGPQVLSALGYSLDRVAVAGRAILRVSGWAYTQPFTLPALLVLLGSRDAWRDPRGRSLLVWMGFGLVQVFLQSRFASYHFLLVLPPFAFLAGWGAGWLWKRGGRTVVVLFLVLQLAQTIHSQILSNTPAIEYLAGRLGRERLDAGTRPVWGYAGDELRVLARWVRKNSEPGDRVLVFGILPQVLLMADRPLYGPYVFHYFLLAEAPLGAGFGDLSRRRETFLRRFDRDPPTLVLVPDSQSVGAGLFETRRELSTFEGLTRRLEEEYEATRLGRTLLFRRRTPPRAPDPGTGR